MRASEFDRRSFLKAAVAVVASAAGAPSVQAHARMVRSEPVNGAKLPSAPKSLELWFNELLDEDFNKVEIYPARQAAEKSHTNLVKDRPRVDPRDRTHLTLNLPPLEPGAYVADYRVLSRDGHTAPGRLTFTVLAKS